MYPGVHLLLMVVGLGFGLINGAQAAGAGRAFPIDSENYFIEEFKRINPNLEWDRTNFLINLSGQYANCALISRGRVDVSRKTPEDDSIGGYNDYTDGRDSDVNAVNGYLKIVIDRWIHGRVLHHQIMVAKRFGCSVGPGCNGEVVAVNCLFSPAAAHDGRPATATATNWPTRTSTTPHNIEHSTTHQKTQPSTTYSNIQPSTTVTSQNFGSSTTHQNIRSVNPNSLARAFTPEQYEEVEWSIKNEWDYTHKLENLSGFETSCSMIGNDDWPFTQVKAYVPDLNFRGIYSYAVNDGTTQGALKTILTKLKTVNSTSKVGCSLIPDCILPNRTMYVVVSCICQDY